MVGRDTWSISCKLLACSQSGSFLFLASPASFTIRIHRSSVSCLWRMWVHQLGRSWCYILSEQSYGARRRCWSRTSCRCIYCPFHFLKARGWIQGLSVAGWTLKLCLRSGRCRLLQVGLLKDNRATSPANIRWFLFFLSRGRILEAGRVVCNPITATRF